MAWPVNAVDGYTTLEAATWKVRADEANAALVLTRNHVAHVEGQRDAAGARVQALSEALTSLGREHGALAEVELRRKEESEALRDRAEVLGGERGGLVRTLEAEKARSAALAGEFQAERVRAEKELAAEREKAESLAADKAKLEVRRTGLEGRVAELEAMASTLGSAVEAARAEREALAAALARAEAELGGERGKTETAVAEVHRLRGLVREADARNERLADELNHYRHLNALARAELDWILKGTGRRSLVVTLPIARAVHRAATWIGMSGVATDKGPRNRADTGDKPPP
jgi:chromosome segregation ATPase